MKTIKYRNRLSVIALKKIKLGDGMVQHHKIVVGPYGEIDIADAELEDLDKFIQSNAENAGAFNYIRKEMANGKTFEEIIADNNIALKNVLFADVSNVSADMTPSEAEQRIKDGVESVLKVAQMLGITPDEFLKLSADELDKAIKKVSEKADGKEEVVNEEDK